MENIHDKYKHFDWYAVFVLELIKGKSIPYFITGSTIVNAFSWEHTVQGHNYWRRVHTSLLEADYTLSAPEIYILRQDALDFYRPLYEELRLTHPELFI